jgi:subtilisin-like proprotein convertase family protein
MKKIFTLLFSLTLFGFSSPVSLKAQLAYSPFLDSLIQLADHQSILLLTRQLAGDTTVLIGGIPTTISSRHYNNPNNSKAADFIFDKFTEYGYTPEVHTFSNGRGENIIATKTGTKYPDKEFIICGHYDNMPSGSVAPGADDNASGTVAVLEAARLLAPFESEYTIRFAAWDEEEIGLVGSYAYAQRAASQGQQILGVLNLDMIAWDSDNDYTYSIATNTLSQSFTNDFLRTTAYYQPQLNHNYYYTTASDHASFWQFDYPAMLAIEDWYDFNEYYHTPGDDIDILNMPYYVAFVRASIANIAAQGWDHRFYFHHDPVVSGNSLEEREAILIVQGSHPLDILNYSPRLYYSGNGSGFDFVTPYEVSGDTLRFMIPGFAFGTEVSYYFAVQDSLGRLTATYPAGGSGINPPGTLAPESFFVYMIDNIFSANTCSTTTPVEITDYQNTYDLITVEATGTVMDVNVNLDITHTRTGELRLILTGPDGTVSLLSDRNGGNGDNYTNTTFDDQAEMMITEGAPPFTGRFRPEMALSAFNGKPVSGDWQIRINDGGAGNTGTLNNWCLHILYLDPTTGLTLIGNAEDEYLGQNYPNPAKGTTTIEFKLKQPSDVQLIIYNMLGQPVAQLANDYFSAGNHLIVAGLHQLTPGRYFYQLKTDRFSKVMPMVILR